MYSHFGRDRGIRGTDSLSRIRGACPVRFRIAIVLAVVTVLWTARPSEVSGEATGALPALRGPSPEGIYEATLGNGLGVLIKEVTTSPIVCVSIWYRAGTRNESAGTTGLAHLLEHMMYKGTAAYGKGVYDDLLEANGGVNNATTWNDRTNYYAVIAKEKVDLAMELEADRMRGALFTEQDLEDEMPVVRNEMEKGEDDPHTELDERLGSTAILEHPYHWPTIGWKSDVEAITAAQIHDYYDLYYQPNNAYLVLVGDLPPEVLLEKAVRHFGPIPAGPEAPEIVTTEPPQKGERRFLIRETGSTRMLGFAFRSPEASHPDAPTLEVLGRLLSDGKASRLHRALVDSGQAVWVSAYNQAFDDPFLFFVYVMLTEEADPDEVEAIVQAELRRLRESPVDVNELARVKKRTRVETLFSRDDITELMFSIGEAETVGGYELYERHLSAIEAVTPEEIRAAAARYFLADSRTVGFYLPRGANGGSWTSRYDDEASSKPVATGAEGMGDRRDPAQSGALPVSLRPPETTPGTTDVGEYERPVADDPSVADDPVTSLDPTASVPRAADSRAAEARAAVPRAADSRDPEARAAATGTRRMEFANGIVLLVRESHDNPTIALRARLEGGLLSEPAGKEGIAALVAESLPLGAGEWNAADLAEQLESLGADLEFSVRTDALELEARCLAEDFGPTVKLLSDVLLRPRFEAEPLVQARRRQEARLQEEHDDTYQVAYHRALEELYGAGSPFARFSAGTPEALAGLTREDAIDYHAELLQGSRWTFAVVGDVDAETARAALERALGSVPPGESLRAPAPELQVPEGETRVLRVPMEDRSQVDIVFVGPGVDPGTAERDAAYVGNVVLGGSFTARLNRSLRDNEGLTYWAGSWFEDPAGKSRWVATLGVNPENVDAGLEGVERELRSFLRDGVEPEEVERARAYAAGSFPIGLATKSDVAAALLEAEALGYGIDYIETYGERIAAQSEAAIERSAAAFANPDRLVVVMAGGFGSD